MVQYLDGVQKTEARASDPKLIATIPYSAWGTASGTIYNLYKNVLSRNAKARTFIIYNTMNQQLPVCTVVPTDSTISIIGPSSSIGGASFISVVPLGGCVAVDTSERVGILAAHVDSVQFTMPIGATLPTSGNVYIYVVEEF